MRLFHHRGTLKGELTLKVIRGTTGRSGFHLIADAPTAHVAVQAFVLEICAFEALPKWPEILDSNPVAGAIGRDVSQATSMGLTGSYWRARTFSKGIAEPSPTEFGAPPAGSQPEGRYNPGGSRVLYLANDPSTAAAECSGCDGSREVWVQEFVISLTGCRAIRLDLDLEEQHAHLHYLLLDSEYLPGIATDFPNVRNPYRPTHFLTFLCERSGISAVEYPSIRRGIGGTQGTTNLVVLGEAVGLVEQMTVGQPLRLRAGTEDAV